MGRALHGKMQKEELRKENRARSSLHEKFQLMLMGIYEQLASIQKQRQGLPWLEVKLRIESSMPDLGK